MFQALFDKFADLLLPFFLGLLIWYGVHYFVLTPRIIKVDHQASNFYQGRELPPHIIACINGETVPVTLDHARLEAALFTASMKKIASPYRNKFSEIEGIVDKKCGVSIELARQAKKQNITDARDQVTNEMKFWFDMLQEFSR